MSKIICILGFVLLFSLYAYAQETLTITTYYPSPSGSYNQLQVNSLGVGDNNINGVLDIGDVPVNAGDVWIRGNVGIGTTAPAAMLHVTGDSQVDGHFNYQQRDCYRINYSAAGDVMCNLGFYVAGIWDDGAGMPGPNGLICCR